MHTKRTSLLLITLWALSQARPASRHHGAHHMSSEEHWGTIGERNLNYIADSADVSDEDRGSRQSKSEERVSTSHESSEGNTYLRKVSSGSLESYLVDDHDWSTRDNEDDNYFRVHQMIHRNWADDADSHEHSDLKQMNKDSSDDQTIDRISLEDQNEIHQDHLYGDITKSKELFDVENDGMLYTPEQVLFTFTGNSESDLTNDEEISGDDSFNEHNEEDLGHTVLPSEGGNPQTAVDNGGQEEDNAISRHPRDSSSSSSSSESRSLDKEDNHIADYRRRHRADSYSSSQEDRYYFDDEGMQGDDATFFESHDADSDMLHGDFNSKESSQESSRGKAKHHSKTIERFARKVYHYVDADSEEDQSPEQEESKSQQEDDVVSQESSQSVEETSQSTENVLSRSGEDANSQSKEMVKGSSRGHSHSRSKETFKSHSRENGHSHSREDDRHSQSREDDRHSHSQEDDRHSRSREDDRHSRSREDDRHSRSREDGRHSRSREDGRHSRSREDGRHSRSREDGRHSRSREDGRHSRSREDGRHSQSQEYIQSHSREDVHSHSKEGHKHSRSREENKHSWSSEDKHSQSREDDHHSWSREDDAHSQSRETSLVSQSREDENSPSREDDNTVSIEDIKSESTEDSRGSYKKAVKKSKEISERSGEHSTGKSKQQRSYSVEDVSNRAPRGSESREVKREHSSSSEKSVSTEESEESSEDTDESLQTDSRLSHSTSSESSKASHESTSSEDSDSHDKDLKSAETSESTEEDNSHSIERDSHSREDTASIEDDSWSRSMELESRKLMFDIDHNKPLSDYDDNDCQDGY
ncbi:dentin matrix acidic phosphoprotein 1 [Anolis carolinensis]|uniref:Dentin matrix acidic phosphoprotein 1 n=1 Tax=Anolis carolinensis TaxID=28377 RepID=G1KYZ5_ANOCA